MPIAKTHLSLKALVAIPTLVCAHTAFSQLSWESRQLDFRPDVNTPQVDAEFQFMNLGQHPVTIRDVKTSCGCTTAALEKKVYQPGEKGSIKAVFTIGDRVGLQQKQIMIQTDSSEEPLVQLTIRAFIPELLKWEPKSVRWELNEPTMSKVVPIATGTEQPMNILGVRSTDDRVFAKLKAIEPGRKYEVAIAPSVTTGPLRATVWVQTDYPPDRPKVYQIPVEIGQAQATTVNAAPQGAPASANAPVAPVALGPRPPAVYQSGATARALPVEIGQTQPTTNAAPQSAPATAKASGAPAALGARPPAALQSGPNARAFPPQPAQSRQAPPPAVLRPPSQPVAIRPTGTSPRASFTLPSGPKMAPQPALRRPENPQPVGQDGAPNSQ
jgi:hypothetical protein